MFVAHFPANCVCSWQPLLRFKFLALALSLALLIGTAQAQVSGLTPTTEPTSPYYETALAELRNGESDRALALMELAAEENDPRALDYLSRRYSLRDVPESERLRGRLLAEKLAQQGKAEGQMIWAINILTSPEFSYLDKSGAVDKQKYAQLAKRPIQERGLEQRAYTMLARAAEQKLLPAQSMAWSLLVGWVGPNSRAKALAMAFQNIPLAPGLLPFKNRLLQMQSYGESYTNLPTFEAVKDHLSLTTGMRNTLKDSLMPSCTTPSIQLIKTRVSRPLSQAVYLPVDAAFLKDMFLVQGNWQETWEVAICGDRETIPIEFQADGLGGAYFQITLWRGTRA